MLNREQHRFECSLTHNTYFTNNTFYTYNIYKISNVMYTIYSINLFSLNNIITIKTCIQCTIAILLIY